MSARTGSARDEVLRRIRSALDGSEPAPEVPRDYRRAADHAPGSPEVVDRLAETVADYKATVHRVGPGGVAAAVAGLLARHTRVAVPPGLDEAWTADAGCEVVRDAGRLDTAALDGVDAVVTGCATAIALTGTIVLDASPDQGRRALTLVPDHHVCVVLAEQVVDSVPEAIARLDPLRPTTFISGPSATSDIELNRVEGVHGPRTLDVVLVSG